MVAHRFLEARSAPGATSALVDASALAGTSAPETAREPSNSLDFAISAEDSAGCVCARRLSPGV